MKQEGATDGSCTAEVRLNTSLSYDVCTERSEGMGPAHVEVGRVEPLQEANVIKTLRLRR